MPTDRTTRIAKSRSKQRKDALRRANVIRKKRSALRARCHTGSVDALELVAGEYDEHEKLVGGARIEWLLRSVPGIGPARCSEVLEVARVRPQERVEALTYAQRRELSQLAKEAREVVVDPAF